MKRSNGLCDKLQQRLLQRLRKRIARRQMRQVLTMSRERGE